MPPDSMSTFFRQLQVNALGRCADRELLDRFLNDRQEAAFEAIVQRHGPLLLGLCRRWVADEHLAEEVLQATFLVLVRKAHTLRKRESLAGWLHGIAHNIARRARLSEMARVRRE